MMQVKWVELGSITGKRVVFWIPSWATSWKTFLDIDELEMWGFERFHDEKPNNIAEWDTKSSLNKFL